MVMRGSVARIVSIRSTEQIGTSHSAYRDQGACDPRITMRGSHGVHAYFT